MIRKATTSDIPRIAEILVFTKRTAYRDIFKDDKGTFNELQVISTADELTEPGALEGVSVYDDGIVKGMMNTAFDEKAATAELKELYTDSFFAGRGVGSALMRNFLEEARQRGIRTITLWVLKENAKAIAFYEKFGFSPKGTERFAQGTKVSEVEYFLNIPLG
ncbi:MAG: GNAT family N-acetyltransferase [Eubacteriaceae bacterium]|nr:GNAT family N-acetyltransferase [Eubacteriaceae bacterium]